MTKYRQSLYHITTKEKLKKQKNGRSLLKLCYKLKICAKTEN